MPSLARKVKLPGFCGRALGGASELVVMVTVHPLLIFGLQFQDFGLGTTRSLESGNYFMRTMSPVLLRSDRGQFALICTALPGDIRAPIFNIALPSVSPQKSGGFDNRLEPRQALSPCFL